MNTETSVPATARCHGDEGASLVEYALLVSLIALVCIGALRYFQAETTQSFSKSASTIGANT